MKEVFCVSSAQFWRPFHDPTIFSYLSSKWWKAVKCPRRKGILETSKHISCGKLRLWEKCNQFIWKLNSKIIKLWSLYSPTDLSIYNQEWTDCLSKKSRYEEMISINFFQNFFSDDKIKHEKNLKSWIAKRMK